MMEFSLNQIYEKLKTQRGKSNFLLKLNHRLNEVDSFNIGETIDFLKKQEKYREIAKINFLLGDKEKSKIFLYKEVEKQKKIKYGNPEKVLREIGDVEKIIEYNLNNKNFYRAAYYAKEKGLEEKSQEIAIEGLREFIKEAKEAKNKKSYFNHFSRWYNPFERSAHLQDLLPVVPETLEILELNHSEFFNEFHRKLEEKGEFKTLLNFYENKKNYRRAAEMANELKENSEYVRLKRLELAKEERKFKRNKEKDGWISSSLGIPSLRDLYYLSKEAKDKKREKFYSEKIFENIEKYKDWWNGINNFTSHDKHISKELKKRFKEKDEYYYDKLMDAYVSGEIKISLYYDFKEPVVYYENKGELEKAVLAHEQMGYFKEGIDYAKEKGFLEISNTYKQISKIHKDLIENNHRFRFKF